MAKDYLGLDSLDSNQSFTYRQQQFGNLSINTGGGNGGGKGGKKGSGTGTGVLKNQKATPTNNAYSFDNFMKFELTTPLQKKIEKNVNEKITGKKVYPNHKVPYAHPEQKKVTQPVQQTQQLPEVPDVTFPVYKRNGMAYYLNQFSPAMAQSYMITRAYNSPYQKIVEDYANKIGIPSSRIPKNAGMILEDYNLTDDEQIRRLLANMAHESAGLTSFKESFYYTDPARIRNTFRSAFDSNKNANPNDYAKNHDKLAAFVYGPHTPKGKELGNKSLEDGLNFAGKGPMQLTGRNLYQQVSDDTGINYINEPDRLLNPEDGFLSAVSYWVTEGIDKAKTPEEARRRVNQSIGFEETMRYYRKLSEK